MTSKKISTKATRVALMAVMVGAIGILLFLTFKKKGTSPHQPLQQVLNYQLAPSFHPDSVIHLSWSTKNKLFEYSRNDRSQPWQPKTHPQLIQNKLNLLAMLHQTPQIKLSSSRKVQIQVTFSNNSQWKGDWDGQVFMWVSGPFQGRGAKLTQSLENLYFQENERAFTQRKIQWCNDRFDKVKLQRKNWVNVIEYKNQKWSSNRNAKNPSSFSTKMEKWMGQHCKIKPEHFIDQNLLMGQPSSYLTVSFFTKSQRTSQFILFENDLIKLIQPQIPDLLFSSQEFSQALKDLTQQN